MLRFWPATELTILYNKKVNIIEFPGRLRELLLLNACVTLSQMNAVYAEKTDMFMTMAESEKLQEYRNQSYPFDTIARDVV